MNFGEIRVFRFERPECGAKAIPSDLWIDASAQLIVVDKEMPVIIDVFGPHGSYREILLSVVIAIKSFSRGYHRQSRLTQVDALSGLARHARTRA
jgi:hypothetical protein